jgi:hypothetical protein
MPVGEPLIEINSAILPRSPRMTSVDVPFLICRDPKASAANHVEGKSETPAGIKAGNRRRLHPAFIMAMSRTTASSMITSSGRRERSTSFTSSLNMIFSFFFLQAGNRLMNARRRENGSCSSRCVFRSGLSCADPTGF